MDRTTFLSNVTIVGGRKIAETDKFTENFLCEEIHNNLYALSFLHPFTDEFKILFEKGMFIKSNPKAFPHIIKYLFTICDPSEFKKKFCWPIYNKAAEATFRNSTLEFLNKLNTKYSLGLAANIKNKILVFPGGMEFMRVIYEIIRLTMQLLLKRNGYTSNECTTTQVASEKAKILAELSKSFRKLNEQIEKHADDLKSKTAEMKKLLEQITSNTHILPSDILEDKFTVNWDDVHGQIVENYIKPETMRFEHFQMECDKLETKLSAICNRQLLKFNMKAINEFSMRMQRLQPKYFHQMCSMIVSDRIDLNNLLLGMRLAIPAMIYSVSTCKPRSIEALAYESNYLSKMSVRLSDLILKSSKLSIDYESIAPLTKSIKHTEDSKVLQDISPFILSTPTITYNANKRADHGIVATDRISLIEDMTHLRAAAVTTKQTISTLALNPILEESMRANLSISTIHSSGKENIANLDPMKILKSIKKKEKLRSNNNLKAKSMHFNLRSHDLSQESLIMNDSLKDILNDSIIDAD